MQIIFTAAAVFGACSLAGAHVTYNATSGSFSCAVANGSYCASDSLISNIIVRCDKGVGQPANCNDNLAGISPVGVKSFAPCYEFSPTAGDAACSFNGTIYPTSGSPFPVPSGVAAPTGSSSTTSCSASSGSGYGSSSLVTTTNVPSTLASNSSSSSTSYSEGPMIGVAFNSPSEAMGSSATPEATAAPTETGSSASTVTFTSTVVATAQGASSTVERSATGKTANSTTTGSQAFTGASLREQLKYDLVMFMLWVIVTIHILNHF